MNIAHIDLVPDFTDFSDANRLVHVMGRICFHHLRRVGPDLFVWLTGPTGVDKIFGVDLLHIYR